MGLQFSSGWQGCREEGFFVCASFSEFPPPEWKRRNERDKKGNFFFFFLTLAWKIPWMEEPGGLQSMGSLRVGHD